VEQEPGGAGKAYVGHLRGDVMPPSWRKGCGRLSTRYAFQGFPAVTVADMLRSLLKEDGAR
jgi:hypothetical protein